LANDHWALQASYPVIAALIGDAAFENTAGAYRECVPSSGVKLDDYGEEFSDFLAHHPTTRTLGYLADLAKLEWAIQRAARSPAAAALDMACIIALPSSELNKLGFVIHPSARIIYSDYPIVQIWEIHQSDYCGDAHLDLRDGHGSWLVINGIEGVEIKTLSEGEFSLLWQLSQGMTLHDAMTQALLMDAEFDLFAFLKYHLLTGTFSNIRFPVQ